MQTEQKKSKAPPSPPKKSRSSNRTTHEHDKDTLSLINKLIDAIIKSKKAITEQEICELIKRYGLRTITQALMQRWSELTPDQIKTLTDILPDQAWRRVIEDKACHPKKDTTGCIASTSLDSNNLINWLSDVRELFSGSAECSQEFLKIGEQVTTSSKFHQIRYPDDFQLWIWHAFIVMLFKHIDDNEYDSLERVLNQYPSRHCLEQKTDSSKIDQFGLKVLESLTRRLLSDYHEASSISHVETVNGMFTSAMERIFGLQSLTLVIVKTLTTDIPSKDNLNNGLRGALVSANLKISLPLIQTHLTSIKADWDAKHSDKDLILHELKRLRKLFSPPVFKEILLERLFKLSYTHHFPSESMNSSEAKQCVKAINSRLIVLIHKGRDEVEVKYLTILLKDNPKEVNTVVDFKTFPGDSDQSLIPVTCLTAAVVREDENQVKNILNNVNVKDWYAPHHGLRKVTPFIWALNQASQKEPDQAAAANAVLELVLKKQLNYASEIRRQCQDFEKMQKECALIKVLISRHPATVKPFINIVLSILKEYEPKLHPDIVAAFQSCVTTEQRMSFTASEDKPSISAPLPAPAPLESKKEDDDSVRQKQCPEASDIITAAQSLRTLQTNISDIQAEINQSRYTCKLNIESLLELKNTLDTLLAGTSLNEEHVQVCNQKYKKFFELLYTQIPPMTAGLLKPAYKPDLFGRDIAASADLDFDPLDELDHETKHAPPSLSEMKSGDSRANALIALKNLIPDVETTQQLDAKSIASLAQFPQAKVMLQQLDEIAARIEKVLGSFQPSNTQESAACSKVKLALIEAYSDYSRDPTDPNSIKLFMQKVSAIIASLKPDDNPEVLRAKAWSHEQQRHVTLMPRLFSSTSTRSSSQSKKQDLWELLENALGTVDTWLPTATMV